MANERWKPHHAMRSHRPCDILFEFLRGAVSVVIIVSLTAHPRGEQTPAAHACSADLFALPTTTTVMIATTVPQGAFVAPVTGGSAIGGLPAVPFTNLPEF